MKIIENGKYLNINIAPQWIYITNLGMNSSWKIYNMPKNHDLRLRY